MEDHGLASTRLSLMRGEHAEALARLSGLFSDAEAEPDERRRDLGLAARLAARGPALESAAARGLLLRGPRPGRPDRPWALRALAVADAGQGRHADVLRIAEHLVAMGGEHAVAGHVVSALARAALDRPEEAAVAVVTAERLAPGDPDVAMARRVVSLWFGGGRSSDLFERRRSGALWGPADEPKGDGRGNHAGDRGRSGCGSAAPEPDAGRGIGSHHALVVGAGPALGSRRARPRGRASPRRRP